MTNKQPTPSDRLYAATNGLQIRDCLGVLGRIDRFRHFGARVKIPDFPDPPTYEFLNCPFGFPWARDLLAEAVICNGTYFSDRSFLDFHILENALGAATDYSINSPVDFDQIDIWRYMASVLYQQIPDQHSINADDLMIFYKIYDHQEIRSVFKDVFECELEDFFQHIFILYCMFKDPIFITWPQKFDGLKINQKLISKIFQKISMPIEDHREFSRANRLSGPDSKFRISSFVGKPIVVIDIARPEIWCPFVGHFIRRLTYGIYYDLIKNSTFANYIGYAFERHVGRTIELFALDHWRVYPEAVSGKKKPKSSVDWLMVDDDVALFIECKFKRPMLESKTDPSDESATLADLKKYASFCAQSIIAAEREHSGMFERELPDDASYIMIVTPEDWLILNGAIGVRVREMCVEELECRGASSHLIEKYSIINVGCKSFGWFLQAAAYFGLSEVLRAHSSERHLNDFTPAFVMNNYVGREGFQPTDAWGQEFNAIMDMSALQIKPER